MATVLAREVPRGVARLAAIGNAVDSLRGASSREVVHAAVMVLCRDFGFARVMVSTVRGQEWSPCYVYDRSAAASRVLSFQGFSVGTSVPLQVSTSEAEVIRAQRAMVVRAAGATDDEGYLVAPITVGRNVIGMLHADLPDPGVASAEDQLDLFEAFTECLAVVYERAVLEEKVSQQRTEVDRLSATVDQLLAAPASRNVEASRGADRESSRGGHRPVVAGLTAREREVMSYVATGATNRDIARCLLISEGTVKSHLKRIAEKLSTTNRAAALAVYLTMNVVPGDEDSR